MNVNNIISKNTLTTEEMVFVVQEYIKEKKDRDVDINLLKGIDLNHPMFPVIYSSQMNKLNRAYDIACEYYFKKLRDEK